MRDIMILADSDRKQASPGDDFGNVQYSTLSSYRCTFRQSANSSEHNEIY